MNEDVFGLVGTAIDNKYRVDAVVGEGGFGMVYRGWHAGFEQPVAIKCLKVPSHFTSDAKKLFFESFRNEGKLLNALSSRHLSIVRVFDFGVTQGNAGAPVPYLVLEWLAGRDLEAILEERRQNGVGPYSEEDAIALLRPAVEAIATAHTADADKPSIAHRDVKPANLFVLRQGPVKVLDFGIAKAMQEGETATQVATRTTSGFSAFSPWYGAPEQFRPGKEGFGATGPWTDVHALGLILVEMVTGRAPLDGGDPFSLFQSATAENRPTPRARGAQVSDGFEAMCAKALALRGKDRFQGARELLAAMDALSQAPRPAAAPAGDAGETPAVQGPSRPEPPRSMPPTVKGTGTEVAPGPPEVTSMPPRPRLPPALPPRASRASRMPVWGGVFIAVAAVGLGALLWPKKNDPEAIQTAEHLTHGVLRRTAADHGNMGSALVQQAISIGDKKSRDPIFERALTEYKLAAQGWESYLRQDDKSPDAYESQFWLADANHNIVVILVAMERTPTDSEVEAARRMAAAVRDSNEDDKYRQPAAFMVVDTAQQVLNDQYRLFAKNLGGVELRKQVRTSGKGDATRAVKDPVPPPVLAAIAARDEYIQRVPAQADVAISSGDAKESQAEGKNADLYAYQSAELYFVYGQFDDAKKHLEPIYREQCGKTSWGFKAWSRLIDMAALSGDIEGVRKLVEANRASTCALDEVQKKKAENKTQGAGRTR